MKLTLGRSLLVLLVGAALVGGGVWYSRDKAAQEPGAALQIPGDRRRRGGAVGVRQRHPSIRLILVNVGTQVSGTVRKLYVDFNDKVEQGQPLLELDQSFEAQTASATNVGQYPGL